MFLWRQRNATKAGRGRGWKDRLFVSKLRHGSPDSGDCGRQAISSERDSDMGPRSNGELGPEMRQRSQEPQKEPWGFSSMRSANTCLSERHAPVIRRQNRL